MAFDTIEQTFRGVFHRADAVAMMRAGGILPDDRSTHDLIDAVARRVEESDRRFVGPAIAAEFAAQFADDMTSGRAVLGTPALSNVWFDNRPLASCSAVPVGGGSSVADDAEGYYGLNMGSGFNFDNHAEPADMLRVMNDHAAHFQETSGCERYVGNMGNLRWDHPRVAEFLRSKVDTAMPHFNISIAFDERAEALWKAGDPQVVRLVNELADSAWACGDPGILLPHRYNAKNALADVSPYITTAPCAEVGLAPGDTCVFGYLSLPAFADSRGRIDFESLAETTQRLVRVLDGLVEDSSEKLPTTASRHLATAKRRVGVAACGLADLLVLQGLAYGEAEANLVLEECLATIQFSAVEASIRLAEQRGPFPWFGHSAWARGRVVGAGATSNVSESDWTALSKAVSVTGLRNSALTALPPSGRSSILLGVNPSIEPFLGDPASSALTSGVRSAAARGGPIRRTAGELPWQRHLAVVETATRWVDEAVSKTINLASTATPEDVWDIFAATLGSNICAMSIYRDGSIESIRS